MTKSLILLVCAFALNTQSFAEQPAGFDDGPIGMCLGFPSAQNFTCTYTSIVTGDLEIDVDIPAGFGCNQSPEQGTLLIPSLDKEIIIYSPKVSYQVLGQGKMVTEITYSKDSKSKDVESIFCVKNKDLK